jgi:hypothetical protein
MTCRSLAIGLGCALLFNVVAARTQPAAAAPMLDQGVAKAADLAAGRIEPARWVCGPYRCWWRPNYFYAPRPFYRPWGYGWRRPWGGWHRGWGWRGGWRRW